MDFVSMVLFLIYFSLKVHLQWDKETIWSVCLDTSSFPCTKRLGIVWDTHTEIVFHTHTHTPLEWFIRMCALNHSMKSCYFVSSEIKQCVSGLWTDTCDKLRKKGKDGVNHLKQATIIQSPVLKEKSAEWDL